MLRAQASRAELVTRIMRLVPADATIELSGGVILRRASLPTELEHEVWTPTFCVIAHGAKEIILGKRRYRYDPARYLITSAALPITTRVVEASPECPYLGFVLRLDPALVGSVMVEVEHRGPRTGDTTSALDVSPLDAGLLDAVVRLVRLLDAPAEARFLAPLVTREIVYRLFAEQQAERLSQIAALGGTTYRIAAAVERIRRDFDRPLRIEEIASELGMSMSAFHRRFKALTALTPIQLQKQLRLQEARRLLVGANLDVASAGRQVGYDDSAYFSREYKRLFGAPPLRHVAEMREGVAEGAGL